MSSSNNYDELYGNESYPPPGILLFSKMIDTTCSSFVPQGLCSDWRSYIIHFGGSNIMSWLTNQSYRVHDVMHTFPSMLSYNDFLLLQQDQQQENNSDSDDNNTNNNNIISFFINNIYKYAFHTSSTSLSVLTTPTSIVTLIVLVLILRLIKSIVVPRFSNIGRTVGRQTHGVEWEKCNEERIVKFGEYVFRLIYHTSISVYGIIYFWDKEWWKFPDGTTRLYSNFPLDPIEPGMTWYYLIQSVYNLDAMISLLVLSFVIKLQNPIASFNNKSSSNSNNNSNTSKLSLQSPITICWSKTVRGDFQEMMIHHIVTNVLIIGSSYFRFTRIGSMVFVVHDISDIPVDLSKLANFLKWKITTICCFASMVLLWAILRLGVLPFVIFKSVLYESILVVTSPGHLVTPILWFCYQPFFVILLGLIITLHVAWFIMFIRMGYILITKNERHDLSEYKNGEKQQQQEYNNTTTTTNTRKNSKIFKKSSDNSFIGNGNNGYHNNHNDENGSNVTTKKDN